MWKNSWGVCIDKSVDILKYARLVKHSIDYTYMQGLKYIVIAGQTEKLQIQVAEHINIEWILQSNEYDIFCGLQYTLKKKEGYRYIKEGFILLGVYEDLKPELKIYLDDLQNNTLYR